MALSQNVNKELLTIRGKKPLKVMKYNAIWLLVSLSLMIWSGYQIFVKGLNFGIDFTGGTKGIYSISKAVDDAEIRAVVSGSDLGEIQIVPLGNHTPEMSKYIFSTKHANKDETVKRLTELLTAKYGADAITLESSEVVGPKVGADLRQSAVLSMIWVCLLISGYIWLRFDFMFAPGALVALIHDVGIALGFFAYSGREFNLPILAAALTILGYSINDTIIIYDRIRENLGRFPKSTELSDVIDISLSETFSRTIITSLTVFLTVLVIFLVGGTLQDFALCLLIGVVVGAYSSIYVASPIYLALHKLMPNRGLASAEVTSQ